MRTDPRDLERHEPAVEDADQAEEAEGVRVVPKLPDAPERFRQDTRPMDGETATNLPPETDLQQRPKVQG